MKASSRIYRDVPNIYIKYVPDDALLVFYGKDTRTTPHLVANERQSPKSIASYRKYNMSIVSFAICIY